MMSVLHLIWIIPVAVALGVCIGVTEACNDLQAILEEEWDYE